MSVASADAGRYDRGMSLLQPVVLGVFLPAIVCAVVLVIGWWPRRQGVLSSEGTWSGAVGLGAGYVLGHVIATGWPPFPPVDATQWLIFLAIIATVVGLLDTRWRQVDSLRGIVRWSWRVLLSVATVWLLCRPLLSHSWGALVAAGWVVGLTIGLIAFWTSIDVLAERVSGASMSLVLLAVAAGGASVLFVSGSALLAQRCGVIAAMLGACLVIGWWCPVMSLARGAVPVVAVVVGGLWISGYLYAEVPPWSAILLAVAPSAAWVGHLRRLRRLAGWQVAVVRFAAVLVVVGAAWGVAYKAMPSDEFMF